MPTNRNIRDHFQRVVNMSHACAVDLSTALDRGQIDVPTYADMVAACRGCTQVGTCDKLLATAPMLAEAPEYCVNRDEFADLRLLQVG